MIYFLIAVAFGIGSLDLVDKLNSRYLDLSDSQVQLYSLVQEIMWEIQESKGVIQGVLLLNNTFTGLSIHQFELNCSQKQFFISSHVYYEPTLDLPAAGFIQEVLKKELKLNTSKINDITTYKANASIALLYKSRLFIKNSEYQIDVLIYNNSKYSYINARPLISMPKTVIKENLKLAGIFTSAFFGFFLTFLFLCCYYKKHASLPFTKGPDIRRFPNDNS